MRYLLIIFAILFFSSCEDKVYQGVVVGTPTDRSIPIDTSGDHVADMTLWNDGETTCNHGDTVVGSGNPFNGIKLVSKK